MRLEAWFCKNLEALALELNGQRQVMIYHQLIFMPMDSGAEKFSGVMDNTEIFDRMLEVLDYENLDSNNCVN